MNKKNKGYRAEQLAAKHLQEEGFRLVERNFSINGGEVDLIASHDSWLVFIEVKFRNDEHFSQALSQLTYAQCQRIKHTARVYMMQKGIDEHQQRIRFDVITVTGEPAQLNWFKDAF